MEDRDWIEYEEHHQYDRLWRYDRRIGRDLKLTDDNLHVYEFSWSPDGGKVAAIAADRPYGWSW
ncbi:MAG: hypothetical protein R2849_19690 [Thermomicrobiales bacterium]